jgi:hypothetical protein
LDSLKLAAQLTVKITQGSRMEGLIGTIIGAILAGGAMILNSYYASKRQEKREDHIARRKVLEKDMASLESLYQETLELIDRIIRKKGRDEAGKIEKVYNIEVKLQLQAPKEVFDKFHGIRSAVADMSSKLTPFPEEFIPKFEGDQDRYKRLEARKNAESQRTEEAKEYLPEIYKKYEQLTELMKNDIAKKKQLQP